MRILVVNAGSSSLKLSLLDKDDSVAFATDVPGVGEGLDDEVLRAHLASAGRIDAVGHRIVHGGRAFTAPTVIDAGVRAALEALVDLAPLHQPRSLHAFDLVSRALPDTPQVGCFDTAFHVTMSSASATYALPAAWRADQDLRRYGFHGLSHAYAAARAASLIGRPIEALRIVTCHLGAGASLAAVDGGRSVDTTMGFTPLDGLVMATRSGSVDPGLILWLAEHAGMPVAEIRAGLEHGSGLLGLAGNADLRVVLAAEADGDADAALAVAVYLHRLRAAIAAMAAAMGGLDALVFTGGVGERSPAIRRRAAAGLEFLGVVVDDERNASTEHDAEVGSPAAAVRAFALRAREDLQIAREVRRLLDGR